MFQYPNRTKVVSKEGDNAVFEIGPLYPGYGVTMANVLRRVLISSIEGSAITSFRISGVDHEFTAIPGVMEDVIEMIMNMKRVRFQSFSDEPVTLKINMKGAKEVTASDIITTSDVKVVNPEQKIATITDKKATLDMELIVEKGIGYVPVEQKKSDKLTVGEIAVDAIFTPIKNVTFTVENVRVGQRTDYNKVLLDITTDGSITPEDAFRKASDILIKHFHEINMFEGDSDVSDESINEK